MTIYNLCIYFVELDYKWLLCILIMILLSQQELSLCLFYILDSSPRLALKSLKLSHNELGPFAGSSLSLLLSCTPSLTHLSLTDCGITGYTLEAHTGFTGALAGLATLKELVLDHNLINDDVNCLAGLSLSLLSLNSALSSSHSIKVL